MINRAKCKLCNQIIESFHATDLVQCKCGAIALDGGESLKCYYKDIHDFVRVDDQGNEIIVREAEEKLDISSAIVDREELLKMLNEMIKNIEGLPQIAMATSVNHYDLLSALLLISAIFRSDCSIDN